MFRTHFMLTLGASAATDKLFLAHSSSEHCPGGSLSACLELCGGPASVQKACARGCSEQCASPSPSPQPAPEPVPSPPTPQPSPEPAPSPSAPGTSVWFGEGCFWERQYAYTLVELDPAGPFQRSNESVSSVAGYAGSLETAAGQVCYEAPVEGSMDYEALGHAEQVRITLDKGSEQEQFAALVHDFFGSFNATDKGFVRPDPQDKGSPYRVTIGIPGGMKGSLYRTLEAANSPRGPFGLTMTLKEDTAGSVDDVFNTVFIMDSEVFPFYQAEQYHQFHSDVAAYGTYYPDWYRHDLWQMQIDLGKIPFGGSTDCPDKKVNHY